LFSHNNATKRQKERKNKTQCLKLNILGVLKSCDLMRVSWDLETSSCIYSIKYVHRNRVHMFTTRFCSLERKRRKREGKEKGRGKGREGKGNKGKRREGKGRVKEGRKRGREEGKGKKGRGREQKG
jgi:hypothetical protein